MPDDLAAEQARLADLPAAIGADLQGFGGLLRCTRCGREQSLGAAGDRLAHGWPKCCGLTMTWVTQKLLDEEKTDG